MKTDRNFAKVFITNKGENWLKNGHPWLFESDVINVEGNYKNGDIVDVLGPKNKYIGSGFINDISKIRVRILSKNINDCFDKEFYKRRIKYAWEYRKSVLRKQDLDNCRVIFGESDQLPGLTVDRFDKTLVVQIATLGLDLIYKDILDSIYEVMLEDGQTIDGIFIRNDIPAREKEGLSQYKEWYYSDVVPKGNSGETIINENDIKYYVDVINGQKTGFFLDQKYNRQLVSRISHGKRVLDCFTHTGSFALNAAKGGAKEVIAVDISKFACEQGERNAKLNNLNVNFVCADVFEYLNNIKKKEFDLIILDPPAFTKSRQTVNAAYNGYKQINLQAMKALGRGGYLVTCSCSHFMPHELFEKMLKEASSIANVELKQISCTQQGPDHPILRNVQETDYLKFYMFQLI